MCDTPSHGSDLWKESIQNCRCYRADTAGGTDGRTDGQTDGVKPIYPQQLRCPGGGGGGYDKMEKSHGVRAFWLLEVQFSSRWYIGILVVSK